MNYVLFLFTHVQDGGSMFKIMIQEAAALASLALFIGMIAIWSQVLGNLIWSQVLGNL
jgi:hypothetical protein